MRQILPPTFYDGFFYSLPLGVLDTPHLPYTLYTRFFDFHIRLLTYRISILIIMVRKRATTSSQVAALVLESRSAVDCLSVWPSVTRITRLSVKSSVCLCKDVKMTLLLLFIQLCGRYLMDGSASSVAADADSLVERLC